MHLLRAKLTHVTADVPPTCPTYDPLRTATVQTWPQPPKSDMRVKQRARDRTKNRAKTWAILEPKWLRHETTMPLVEPNGRHARADIPKCAHEAEHICARPFEQTCMQTTFENIRNNKSVPRVRPHPFQLNTSMRQSRIELPSNALFQHNSFKSNGELCPHAGSDRLAVSPLGHSPSAPDRCLAIGAPKRSKLDASHPAAPQRAPP